MLRRHFTSFSSMSFLTDESVGEIAKGREELFILHGPSRRVLTYSPQLHATESLPGARIRIRGVERIVSHGVDINFIDRFRAVEVYLQPRRQPMFVAPVTRAIRGGVAHAVNGQCRLEVHPRIGAVLRIVLCCRRRTVRRQRHIASRSRRRLCRNQQLAIHAVDLPSLNAVNLSAHALAVGIVTVSPNFVTVRLRFGSHAVFLTGLTIPRSM